MLGAVKILCLHGWRSSAAAMDVQFELAGFQEAFPNFEFVTINAPHLAPTYASKAVQRLDPQGPYCQWWDATNVEYPEEDLVMRYEYKGVEESLDYISQILKSKGPFDGILGFSQGAAIASIVASAITEGDKGFKDTDIKFFIYIGGFPIRDHKILKKVKGNWAKSEIPSLHIYGDLDPIKTESMMLAKLTNQENTKEYMHEKGHSVPKINENLKQMFQNIACRVI